MSDERPLRRRRARAETPPPDGEADAATPSEAADGDTKAPEGRPRTSDLIASDGPTASASSEAVHTHGGGHATVVERGRGERAPTPEAPPAPRREAPAAVEVSEDIDFAALMAGQGGAPQEEPSFEPGELVRGVVEVVSLHGDAIFLDLGGKATGYVLKDELRDAEGEITVERGDTIEGVVAGETANGVHVRMKLGAGADAESLRDAHEGKLPVEGKVTAVNKGGYEVLVAGQRAFCPFSQIDVYRPEDPEAFVGRTLTFRITELRPGSVVVSRAAILREEQAEKAAETLARITEGARLTGRVRSIQKFGAFVDLGGVDGLVHISELSWERDVDPRKVVELGQEVEVVVLEVDESRERIALSIKATQGDPWETSIGGLSVGQTIQGSVARLTHFGAFVTIVPGVDGLVHISDLAHHRVRHPGDVLSLGDAVEVKITDIDLDRRRIALSLKALADDPWDDVETRYKPGQQIDGTVESVQDFGVFITVEPGVTALLPGSESDTGGRPLATSFRVGDTVEAKVLRVEPDARRMALTRKDDADRGGDRPPRRGPKGDRGPKRDRGAKAGGRKRGTLAYSDDDKGGEVGSLGAALLQALNKDDK